MGNCCNCKQKKPKVVPTEISSTPLKESEAKQTEDKFTKAPDDENVNI